MKKILVICAGVALLQLASCAAFNTTPEQVDPVGPIVYDIPAQEVTTTTTTTTTGGDGITLTVDSNDAFANEEGVTASVGGMTVSAGPNGAYASAGGVDASASVSANVTFGGDAATTQTTQTTTTTVSAPVTCGLSLEAHAALLDAIRQCPVGNEADIVRSAASSNYITVDQAVAILKVVRDKFTLGITDSAVAMYPSVCDPGNWFKVYDTKVVGAISADEIREQVESMPKPRGFVY